MRCDAYGFRRLKWSSVYVSDFIRRKREEKNYGKIIRNSYKRNGISVDSPITNSAFVKRYESSNEIMVRVISITD